MSETATIVTWIVGSAVGIITILGTFIGLLMIQTTNRRLDDTNRRLERIETRVDDTNRDIGELRDRTGKLEGALIAFINNQTKADAA